MAYKLYINNKLFNGIGNNNYNKGTITINGTVYQYDNSSGSGGGAETLVFKWRPTSENIAPTTGYFVFDKNSFASIVTSTSNNELNGETFTYQAATNSNTRKCTINAGEYFNNYDVAVTVYMYTTSNRTITIGTETTTINQTNQKNRVISIDGEVTENNNIITVSGNFNWCGIDITLTPKS